MYGEVEFGTFNENSNLQPAKVSLASKTHGADELVNPLRPKQALMFYMINPGRHSKRVASLPSRALQNLSGQAINQPWRYSLNTRKIDTRVTDNRDKYTPDDSRFRQGHDHLPLNDRIFRARKIRFNGRLEEDNSLGYDEVNSRLSEESVGLYQLWL